MRSISHVAAVELAPKYGFSLTSLTQLHVPQPSEVTTGGPLPSAAMPQTLRDPSRAVTAVLALKPTDEKLVWSQEMMLQLV